MTAPPPPSAFLALLNESLSFEPERSDLWMTRFDILRSLGFKREFAHILVQATAQPAIRKALDWKSLHRMWDEIAPGERFPTEAEERMRADSLGVPDPVAAEAPVPVAGTRKTASGAPARSRRFNDVAMKIAGPELAALSKAYNEVALQPGFLDEFSRKTRALLVRPTPLEFSGTLSRAAGHEKRIYLKREDQRGMPVEAEHAAAQCYIAWALMKTAVVTANDVDLHALEVATVAPFFDLKCTVVVRPSDLKSKPQLIADLKGLDANIAVAPKEGMLTTDPREAAVRLWQHSPRTMHLALSLGMAPAPYPAMANAFQALLGREAETQYTEMASLLNRPRTLVASVGSEADSLGFVLPFLNRRDIRVAYAEPEPGGVAAWKPSKRLKPYNGQIREHSWLRGVGRIQHVPITDAGATAARELLLRDGIKAGVEDARAVALALLLSAGDPTPRDFLVLLG